MCALALMSRSGYWSEAHLLNACGCLGHEERSCPASTLLGRSAIVTVASEAGLRGLGDAHCSAQSLVRSGSHVPTGLGLGMSGPVGGGSADGLQTCPVGFEDVDLGGRDVEEHRH